MKLNQLVEKHPFGFVIGLFLLESGLAIPFVVTFKLLNLDLELLRLVIPIAQSLFVLWVVWALGWFSQSGFVNHLRDMHLYWYPVLLAFVPALIYGSIQISTGPLLFYAAAILFTGISEEILSRGIMLPALIKRGTWTAIFFAAGLFSVAHFSNLAFTDHGIVEITEVLISTFGFAVLYGALFIRTQNIWPLIFLHSLHDYIFVTSGTAGPFVVEPIAPWISIVLAILNIGYGIFIIKSWKPSSPP